MKSPARARRRAVRPCSNFSAGKMTAAPSVPNLHCDAPGSAIASGPKNGPQPSHQMVRGIGLPVSGNCRQALSFVTSNSNARGEAMTYEMKPLPCDPAGIEGMSEKLIVSHYQNNYGGAVSRLNAIAEQLATIDFAT